MALAPIATDDEQDEDISPSEPVLPVNADVAKAMSASRVFKYRGRKYIVRPTPFHSGIQMRIISIDAAAHAKYTTSKSAQEQYRVHLRKIADEQWSIMIPMSPIRRLLKRMGLLRNPLRNASEAEIGQLADFFSVHRMSSSVQF